MNFTFARCRDVGKKYNVRERGGGKNIVFGQLYTPLYVEHQFEAGAVGAASLNGSGSTR
jgi:hypothetical protein